MDCYCVSVAGRLARRYEEFDAITSLGIRYLMP